MSLSLTALPFLQASLDVKLDAGDKLLISLNQLSSQSNTPDNNNLDSIYKSYNEQRQIIQQYREQLTSWRSSTTTREQQQAIQIFNETIHKVILLHDNIFTCIDSIKEASTYYSNQSMGVSSI